MMTKALILGDLPCWCELSLRPQGIALRVSCCVWPALIERIHNNRLLEWYKRDRMPIFASLDGDTWGFGSELRRWMKIGDWMEVVLLLPQRIAPADFEKVYRLLASVSLVAEGLRSFESSSVPVPSADSQLLLLTLRPSREDGGRYPLSVSLAPTVRRWLGLLDWDARQALETTLSVVMRNAYASMSGGEDGRLCPVRIDPTGTISLCCNATRGAELMTQEVSLRQPGFSLVSYNVGAPADVFALLSGVAGLHDAIRADQKTL